MEHLSAKELRDAWRKFFEKNGHLYVESKSLIPNNDPSLLWINSGVATLKRYFSGLDNPPSKRLVNLQKAVRTNDIENVGKTARHHTFFEMMGNFSIGDYFKLDAIKFAHDFLIDDLKIDQNLLYITVYREDEVAYNRWLELGIEPSHIFKEGKDRNFWDVGNGPCGPCTEIYFDRGEKYDPDHLGIKLLEDDIENDRYVEIWNVVFSEFNNDGNDNYKELERKNIDTGAGYERVLSVLQEVPTNYDTDLFLPLIRDLENYTKYRYDVEAFFSKDKNQLEINRWFKVIVDHIKSAVFMIADGALPGNKDRGYILRRLIRRALSFAERLQLQETWLVSLVKMIIKTMGEFYPYLFSLQEKIITVIIKESSSFTKTLKEGLKQFRIALAENKFDANTVFILVTTYGFPIVLVDEMCDEQNLTYDKEKYEELYRNHQLISKSENQNNIKVWAQQNKNLLNLNVKSVFDYNAIKFDDAKVVALFDANFEPVQQLVSDGWVVLDKTTMYATGGGQLHDDGWINDFEIDNVIKGPNGQHLHHLESCYLHLNEKVSVRHDEDTRIRLRCNHTGVHIIEALLKKNISNSIKQAGAFKSKSKFSFDFNYENKLTSEQIADIEAEANQIIHQQIPVSVLHTSLQEAKDMHATMDFEDMYEKQKQLRLIRIPGVSIELCGGTHAFNTSNLEILKITSFVSLGSGIWRIEGFTRFVNYFDYSQNRLNTILKENENKINDLMQASKNWNAQNLKNCEEKDVISKLNLLEQTITQAANTLNGIHAKQVVENIREKITKANKEHRMVVQFSNVEQKLLAETLRSELNNLSSVLVLINHLAKGFSFYIGANKQYLKDKNLDLVQLANNLTKKLGGNGGGKNNYFQGASALPYELKLLEEFLKQI